MTTYARWAKATTAIVLLALTLGGCATTTTHPADGALRRQTVPVFPSLTAQDVKRLRFVEIHGVFERGRPDLPVELSIPAVWARGLPAFNSAIIGQPGHLDLDRLEGQPHLDKFEHERSDQDPHTDDENGGDHDG